MHVMSDNTLDSDAGRCRRFNKTNAVRGKLTTQGCMPGLGSIAPHLQFNFPLQPGQLPHMFWTVAPTVQLDQGAIRLL